MNNFNSKIVSTEYQLTGQTDAYNYNYVCVSLILISIEKLEVELKELVKIEEFINFLKSSLTQVLNARTRGNNFQGLRTNIFSYFRTELSNFIVEGNRATFIIEESGNGYPWICYNALYTMELQDDKLHCKLIHYGKTTTTTDVFGSEGKRTVRGSKYLPEKINSTTLMYKVSEDGGKWYPREFNLQ